jgi:hypothetical protein
VTETAFCSGSPAPGDKTNEFPIIDANLEFVKKVKNGVMYMGGPSNMRVPVVHVYGSAYEMGQAQGQLTGDRLAKFVKGTFKYIADMVIDGQTDKKFPHIPKTIKEKIITMGFDKALDWNEKMVKEFTPQSYFDEMQGIADATEGIEQKDLIRLNLFPEITKASCSFFGAWKSATKDGHTYHMRSLDYDDEGPFADYPQITIYHPTDGNTFASVGWPGTLGALTGMSQKQMGINEIGVSFADDSFGQGTPNTPPEKVKGKPWMYVVRDILQHTSTLEEGIKSVQDSNRTCNLVIGIGDGKAQEVNGIEYSGYVAIPYNDQTQLPVNATWHPKIPDTVYNGMDWDCPSFTSALGAQLQKYHGAIEPANIVGNILPTVQTGNLHIGLYDLTSMQMWVSFARKDDDPKTDPQFAYERQFWHLDMNQVFAEPKPTSA